MNKKDLKVGVEYAVSLKPNDVANQRYDADKSVFKATLVSVAAPREERWTYTKYSGCHELKWVTGIAVDAPAEIKGNRYARLADNSVARENGRAVVEPFTHTYPTTILESAKFIICTWEDWQARLVARAEGKIESERRAEEAAQARTDAHPGIKARAEGILAVLEQKIGPLTYDLTDSSWNGRNISHNGRSIGEIKYGKGVDAEDVILAVSFTFGAEMLAKVLDV